MKLTENFNSEEFGVNLTTYQLSLIRILARELQKVRNFVNTKYQTSNIKMKITSGVRTPSHNKRLESLGYNPSKTSDHLCGYQITANPTLGAADVVFRNLPITYEILHKLLCEEDSKGTFKFGQIILERNKSGFWIHFSNHPSFIYTPEICNGIIRANYLKSMDNGKSYEVLKL